MPDQDALWNLVAYMAQIACVGLLAEVALRVVPVRSAAFRYAYWRVVLAGALILPWLFRATPSARAASNASTADAIAAPIVAPFLEFGAVAPAWTNDASSWVSPLLWVFAAGAIARLLWLAAGLLRLRGFRRRGVPIVDGTYDEIQRTLGTRAEMRSVDGLPQPATFGLWRPVVLLPTILSTCPESTRRAVVAHELVHVRQRDWLWVLTEEMLRTVFWFHPAVWWLVSRVRLTREEFTDHVAVLATGSRRAYIEALLAFADAAPLEPAPAFARRAHLFHRIVLISKEAVMSSRRVVISGAALAALLVAGAWYSSEAFPLPPSSRSATATMPAGQAAVARQGVNVVTPENPIPRRLLGPAIPYPLELAATDLGADVRMGVVIDANGSVTSASVSVRFVGAQPTSDIERERAVEAFTSAARNAVTAWQYEPPAQAPLAFAITLRFRPAQEAIVSQEAFGAGAAGAAAALRLQDTEIIGRPSPVRTGYGLFAKTKHVEPVYPEAARSAGVGGVVILEATIDERGRIANPRILRSRPLLDQAVLDAVRQWEYVPTLLNGVPVPVMITLTMQFLPEA